MTTQELNKKLDKMRIDGLDYSYIEGFEAGAKEYPVDDLSALLTEMRNNGENYKYIDGFKDGYNDF